MGIRDRSISDVTVDEGTGTATITASVDNAVTGTDLVITLSDGKTITIAVGDSTGTSAAFAVQGDDPYVDGSVSAVTITSPRARNVQALHTTACATININDTIDPLPPTESDNLSPLAEDTNNNGIPDGAYRYPSFLNELFHNQQPVARYYGSTIIQGGWVLLNFVFFAPATGRASAPRRPGPRGDRSWLASARRATAAIRACSGCRR